MPASRARNGGRGEEGRERGKLGLARAALGELAEHALRRAARSCTTGAAAMRVWRGASVSVRLGVGCVERQR